MKIQQLGTERDLIMHVLTFIFRFTVAIEEEPHK